MITAVSYTHLDVYKRQDNNSAECAIKNFAVGRRNWLFAKSIRGADASAVVYSIAETLPDWM